MLRRRGAASISHRLTMNEMRAVQYSEYGAVPTLVSVAEPHCPPDGVLIEVRATGVCRSDWHAWQGRDPVQLPHVPGHEFAGRIAEVGPEVTRRQVGERVTVPFVCGCGRCEFCLTGDAQVCPQQTQPGFTGPGSFAELVAIPAADLNVVPLPDSVEFVTAASLGCRFATAYRALTAHGRVQRDDWVAVHGCGGVGLSVVMIATALGARVVAIDVSSVALLRAGELGAEVLVAGGDDVTSHVMDVTNGGTHVSVDAVGSTATALASVSCLRPRGRHVQIGLLQGRHSTPPLPMDRVVAKELEIHGSHGMAARDYPALLELVDSRVLRPDLLVGQEVGLDEAGAALAAMSQPAIRAGITVVRLN